LQRRFRRTRRRSRRRQKRSKFLALKQIEEKCQKSKVDLGQCRESKNPIWRAMMERFFKDVKQ
jgi:hypothetical protein